MQPRLTQLLYRLIGCLQVPELAHQLALLHPWRASVPAAAAALSCMPPALAALPADATSADYARVARAWMIRCRFASHWTLYNPRPCIGHRARARAAIAFIRDFAPTLASRARASRQGFRRALAPAAPAVSIRPPPLIS